LLKNTFNQSLFNIYLQVNELRIEVQISVPGVPRQEIGLSTPSVGRDSAVLTRFMFSHGVLFICTPTAAYVFPSNAMDLSSFNRLFLPIKSGYILRIVRFTAAGLIIYTRSEMTAKG